MEIAQRILLNLKIAAAQFPDQRLDIPRLVLILRRSSAPKCGKQNSTREKRKVRTHLAWQAHWLTAPADLLQLYHYLRQRHHVGEVDVDVEQADVVEQLAALADASRGTITRKLSVASRQVA